MFCEILMSVLWHRQEIPVDDLPHSPCAVNFRFWLQPQILLLLCILFWEQKMLRDSPECSGSTTDKLVHKSWTQCVIGWPSEHKASWAASGWKIKSACNFPLAQMEFSFPGQTGNWSLRSAVCFVTTFKELYKSYFSKLCRVCISFSLKVDTMIGWMAVYEKNQLSQSVVWSLSHTLMNARWITKDTSTSMKARNWTADLPIGRRLLFLLNYSH